MLKFWHKNKSILKYILFLFIVSRIILTLVGTASKIYFRRSYPEVYDHWNYSEHTWLDVWGIWDTGYYLDIAKRGYNNDQNFEFPVSIPDNEQGKHQTTFHFFPLYPFLIRFLNFFANNYYLSAIIVSNVSTIISAFLLYKLIIMEYEEKTAKLAVKYFFLFPSAFIYSGAFTEAVALVFILSSFLLAYKRRIIPVGLSIALALLTKTSGGLAIISLAVKRIDSSKKIKYVFAITLPIVVLLALFTHHYYYTGNFFKYFETARAGWGVRPTNPLEFITLLIIYNQGAMQFLIIKNITLFFILAEICLIVYSYKKINFVHWLYWLSTLVLPLSSGFAAGFSFPRHVLLSFPQFAAIALLAKKRVNDQALSITFAVLQIALMALWVNAYGII